MPGRLSEFEQNLTKYQDLLGFAMPGIFAAVAASCETKADGLLALAVMTATISRAPEWKFLRDYRERNRRKRTKDSVEEERVLDRHIGMHPVPSIIVVVWLFLIGFGVIR